MLKIIAIMEVEGFVFAMNGEKTFRLLKNFAFPKAKAKANQEDERRGQQCA
jgi:hypothetical protein